MAETTTPGRMTMKISIRQILFYKVSLRQIIRALLFGFVCVVTVIALVVAEENWRGKRAWERCKREIEARGQSLNFADYIRPPVLDDQNFWMTPLFKPLFEESPKSSEYYQTLKQKFSIRPPSVKQGVGGPYLASWDLKQPLDLDSWKAVLGASDIFEYLDKCRNEITEVREALRRPYARLPVDSVQSRFNVIGHSMIVFDIGQYLALKSVVEIREQRSDLATDSILDLLRLAELLSEEPSSCYQSVRIGMIDDALSAFWEGLTLHRFNESQLLRIQKAFGQIDLLKSWEKSEQAEQAYVTDYCLDLLSGGFIYSEESGYEPVKITDDSKETLPPYWRWHALLTPKCLIYQNLTTLVRFRDQVDLAAVDVANKRVYPEKAEAVVESFFSNERKVDPYAWLIRNQRGISPLLISLCRIQTGCDQALQACALEHYWLEKGEYPGALDELGPEYLSHLPHDMVTGESYKYLRKPYGYVLYSLGWDEVDNGGDSNGTATNQPFESGDWVWSTWRRPAAGQNITARQR